MFLNSDDVLWHMLRKVIFNCSLMFLNSDNGSGILGRCFFAKGFFISLNVPNSEKQGIELFH